MNKQEMAIQTLTDALFNHDKGKTLPYSVTVCEEHGMRGLCGNKCPDYGSRKECLDGRNEDE